MTANGEARSFTGEAPSPFKTRPISPLRTIPGGDCVEAIKIDLMHVYNLGFGGDFVSSAILLLARMKCIFAGREIENRLDDAYEKFYSWCVRHKKTTSVPSFEPAKFKVTKWLVYIWQFCFHGYVVLACVRVFTAVGYII